MPGLAPAVQSFSFLNGEVIDPIYLAAVEAVEEAVVNAIVAGEDVGGRGRCGWPGKMWRVSNHPA